MAFTKHIVPPGGWSFKEGEIILEEESYDKLIVALTQHRLNNGKPVGSPQEEINEYFSREG